MQEDDPHKDVEMTPDDIISMDLLVYGKGSILDQESWERIKSALMKLAHKNAR